MIDNIPDKIIEQIGQMAQSLQIIMCIAHELDEKERIDKHLRKIQACGDDIKTLARVFKVL